MNPWAERPFNIQQIYHLQKDSTQVSLRSPRRMTGVEPFCKYTETPFSRSAADIYFFHSFFMRIPLQIYLRKLILFGDIQNRETMLLSFKSLIIGIGEDIHNHLPCEFSHALAHRALSTSPGGIATSKTSHIFSFI